MSQVYRPPFTRPIIENEPIRPGEAPGSEWQVGDIPAEQVHQWGDAYIRHSQHPDSSTEQLTIGDTVSTQVTRFDRPRNPFITNIERRFPPFTTGNLDYSGDLIQQGLEKHPVFVDIKDKVTATVKRGAPEPPRTDIKIEDDIRVQIVRAVQENRRTFYIHNSVQTVKISLSKQEFYDLKNRIKHHPCYHYYNAKVQFQKQRHEKKAIPGTLSLQERQEKARRTHYYFKGQLRRCLGSS